MNPRREKIPGTVYWRYLLMNLPGLGGLVLVLVLIRHWFDLPGWIFWGLIACWIVKDVVLFPFVRRAYEPDGAIKAGRLDGKKAIVKTPLDPTGYVQVNGELWRAERADSGPSIEEGRPVRVRKREGLTLYVVPEPVEDGRKREE